MFETIEKLTSLYVGAEWVEAADSKAVINPATEEAIGREYGHEGLNEFTYRQSIAFHGE